MNPKPTTLPAGLSREAIAAAFRRDPRASIPIVDQKGRVRGLAQLTQYLTSEGGLPNRVVILVGGLGKRLLPLTADTPKAMLHVGDKPILETIIEQCAAAGLTRFTLALEHHADHIRAHFGDGSRFGVSIDYVREKRPLGTAGALSLLRARETCPLIVMNGDLLTKIDFAALLRFHAEEKSLVTLCVREYEFQVPFGVVSMSGHSLSRIVEKPTHHFFVSAGIYVLEPAALKRLRRGARCNMPDLIEALRKSRRGSVSCFPIREYWIDIGRIEEYRRAQNDFPKHF
jgi:NDP-sugar pyrophosphorylase family protein